MISKLKQFLPEEQYWIDEENSFIEVRKKHSNYVEMENFFRLYIYLDGYSISFISRNQATIYEKISNENLACAALISFIYYFYAYPRNNEFIQKLEDCAEKGVVEDAYNLIKTECPEKYFSLLTEKNDAVCLLKEIDLFNIYYIDRKKNKVFISSDKRQKWGIVVTYNFAKKLNEYNVLFQQLKKNFGVSESSYYILLQYHLLRDTIPHHLEKI